MNKNTEKAANSSDGPVRMCVSSDCRYLQQEDGEPFVWIGDTAWELFSGMNLAEAKEYLSVRAEQGFNLIQAVALSQLGGPGKVNASGHVPLHGLDPERPNEAFFAHVDAIMAEAERLGLRIGFLPTWGDKVIGAYAGGGPIIFNKENAYAYGKFLGERYRDNPLVWILGGDREVPSVEVLDVWRAMGRGLRDGDGGAHLITFHPCGGRSSADESHNESWLDFNMYQSGHRSHLNAVYEFADRHALLVPRKPFVDGEPAYEDIPVAFFEFVDWQLPRRVPDNVLGEDGLVTDRSFFKKGFITDHDVRVHAFWNFLSGACGYTYGNNAVWQVYRKGNDSDIPCLLDWRDSLLCPGAQQMLFVKRVFEEYSLAKLVPDQSIAFGPNLEGPNHVRAAGSSDGTFALVYLTCGAPVKVVLGKIAGEQVRARWYKPKDGTYSEPEVLANVGIQKFAPPRSGPEEDWLLVLDIPKSK